MADIKKMISAQTHSFIIHKDFLVRSLVLVLLFIAGLIVGCNIQVQDPVIEVKMSEGADGASIEVSYPRHHSNNGVPYIAFSDPEDLDKYQKQVDFLSLKLKEAKEKMPRRQEILPPVQIKIPMNSQ